MDSQDLINRFRFHPPDGNTGPTHERIRALCLESALVLNDLLPEGREKGEAVTSLEQVMFWSNAAVARAPRVSD